MWIINNYLHLEYFQWLIIRYFLVVFLQVIIVQLREKSYQYYY